MDTLENAAERFWDHIWHRLYDKGTSLFYDNISSYDIEHRFDHLPKPEEIRRLFPNPNGWGTGMEDSSINGGVMLAAVCDRYAATGDDSLRKAALRVFKGLQRCATQSSRKGFILRSVSPLDDKSYYPESSRDQITHFVHGLWRYAHSELCHEAERKRISELMQEVCADMERMVVAENGYNYCREDGTPGNVSIMWNKIKLHEACRLPCVYAVGWDLTGDRHWLDCFHRYAGKACDWASGLDSRRSNNAFAMLQHQVSLEVIAQTDTGDSEIRRKAAGLMEKLARGMEERYFHEFDEGGKSYGSYKDVDVAELNLCQWREGPRIEKEFADGTYWVPGHKHNEAYQRAFRPLRSVAEALLCVLIASDDGLSGRSFDLLRRLLTIPEVELAWNYSIIYPQAAYWRHQRNEKGIVHVYPREKT